MDEKLAKKILQTKKYSNIKNLIINDLIQKKQKPENTPLKIVMLNAPCHGNGDIMFAIKLYTYLKEWYNADIKILTTQPKVFKNLGFADMDSIVALQTGEETIQCRKFSDLIIYDKKNKKILENIDYDVIFVAPLNRDFDPKLSDVKNLIPTANSLNTYFFSEYNDDPDKGFDFPTGVGGDNMGMMFTYKKNDVYEKPKNLPNPYSMIYITDPDHDENAVHCYESFLQMLTKAIKVPKLDVVIPNWIAEDILENGIPKGIDPFYQTIRITTDSYTRDLSEGKNILNFRADIFPVSNKEMKNIIKYSVRYILVTGDQSITDVLNCCYNDALPFYQVVSWKEDFAKNLGKYLPQKYIANIDTACGTMKAITYKPDFSQFMKKQDFRINARPKLDAVLYLSSSNDIPLYFMKKAYLSSKNGTSFVRKYQKFIRIYLNKLEEEKRMAN